MTLHKHHVIPVHQGGENGPTILIDAVEHAEHHAIEFIEGRDNGFHMGLLPLLSPKLEELVKAEQSRRMKTEWNPGWGTSYIEGRAWFNNGVTEVLEFECPKGFSLGRLPTTRPKQAEALKGKKWWNNGETEAMSKTQPEGYVRGRLPGQKRKRRKG